MSDYISREAAIELYEQFQPYIAVKAVDFRKALEQLHAADVESAIHCRDCRWGRSHNFDGTRICEYHDDMAKHDDDYCSRAERREDERSIRTGD